MSSHAKLLATKRDKSLFELCLQWIESVNSLGYTEMYLDKRFEPFIPKLKGLGYRIKKKKHTFWNKFIDFRDYNYDIYWD